MTTLPPLPNWQELHPLVNHLPVALLLLAPLFVLAGAVLRRGRRRLFLSAALVLMLSGTALLYVTAQTGHLASSGHQISPEVNDVLQQHRTLASEARAAFTVVTAIFALLLLLNLRFRLSADQLDPVLTAAFLAFYALGVVLLIGTAHRGEELVHEFGL